MSTILRAGRGPDRRGAALLIRIGVLLVSGQWDRRRSWLRAWIGPVGLNETFR